MPPFTQLLHCQSATIPDDFDSKGLQRGKELRLQAKGRMFGGRLAAPIGLGGLGYQLLVNQD